MMSAIVDREILGILHCQRKDKSKFQHQIHTNVNVRWIQCHYYFVMGGRENKTVEDVY